MPHVHMLHGAGAGHLCHKLPVCCGLEWRFACKPNQNACTCFPPRVFSSRVGANLGSNATLTYVSGSFVPVSVQGVSAEWDGIVAQLTADSWMG